MNHDVNDVNNKTQQPQLSSKIALLKQLIRKEGLLNLFRAKFSIQRGTGASNLHKPICSRREQNVDETIIFSQGAPGICNIRILRLFMLKRIRGNNKQLRRIFV